MTETMEEYMRKTRVNYESSIARPKIDDKDHFELKGQFLKELRDYTSSGSDHEDANEHIEKVLEIADLFHIPNITQDQEVILFYNGLEVSTRQILDSKGSIPTKTAADAKLNNLGREIKKVNEKVYAAQVGCELCKGPHYTKDCPLKEEGKTLEEAYYTQFGVPFQQGGQYRAAASRFYQRNTKRHEENSNLIKKIQASIDAATRNQGASIKTLEIQIKQMSNVLQERGFESLPSSTKTNPRDHVKSILATVKADMT
ncbi:DNA-directed DNA polymerase [Tanacetum coccineum]